MASRIGLAAAGMAIVLLGAWFRVVGTAGEPLWLDEAYSAYAAGKGFGFLWNVVPLYETHPPFYYSLLRLWTLPFGDSLIALRALGMTCAIVALLPIGLAAREIALALPRRFTTPLLMIGAALLIAGLARGLVEMAREVRPYPVMILVYAIGMAALLRLGRIAEAERRIAVGPFALYMGALALMLWLHNLGVLYGAAMGLAFLALVARPGLSRRDWSLVVGGHLLVALVWLPAVLILADQAPTWVRSTWLRFSWTDMQWKLAMLIGAPGRRPMMAALPLLALGTAALLRDGPGRRMLAALIALMAVPVAASLAISVTIAPVFIVRTLTPVGVPAALLMAAAVGGWRGVVRWIALLALTLLAVQLIQFNINARHANAQQNWYGTIRWLAPRYRAGDEVWAYPNEGALPFDYAARDASIAFGTVPIPTPIPTLDGGPGAWNPTGSRGVFSLPRERLRAIARSPHARGIETIWLFRLGANAYDVGDVLLGELTPGRVRVARWTCGPIDIIGLRRAGPGVVPDETVDGCTGKPWPRSPLPAR